MNALKLSGLSKMYKIYDGPRARVKEFLSLGRSTCHREFWALRDVSFEVPKGQCIGIIGKNGAGKSTLLKLLTGVTRPTSGSVEAKGRVSALLELGAGFHPEFTGRDNVYMNAALMGMDKAFIDERFPDIASFAELGEFMEMPIKFYSSGMIVRLGFSVAINIDPEVLIIDEALAVGDIGFQRKCMKRMRDFRRAGVTIALVTHSLSDLGGFCDRVVMLKDGKVALDSDPDTVIERYRKEMQSEEIAEEPGSKRWNPLRQDVRTAHNLGGVTITGVDFIDGEGKLTDTAKTGGSLTVRIRYKADIKVKNPLFRVEFFRSDGLFLSGSNTYRHNIDVGELSGEGAVEVEFPNFTLLQGRFFVSAEISPDEYASSEANVSYDKHDMAYELTVVSGREHGGGLVYNQAIWRPVGAA